MLPSLFRLAGLVLAGALLSPVAVDHGLFAQSLENEFHISVDAEFFVIHRYSQVGTHKAFAISPGSWGIAYEMSSPEVAANIALERCKHALESNDYPTPDGECVLFDVDNRPTGKAGPIGEDFGTVAKGADLPWQAGGVWDATTSAARGTLLFVDGCNRPTVSGWVMAWVNYYRAAGFRVVFPDSFAETRDPETCGAPKDIADINKQTRIIKLRSAQTLRTIAGIRRKYPGEPLYLHGHSEGGWVVQSLGKKVNGIIVTGTNCGFGQSGYYLAAEDVPIVVIVGTRDIATEKAGSAEALSAHCRKVAGIGQMSWISVPGMSHYAAPWWPEIDIAVSEFLKTPSQMIRRRSTDGVAYPSLPPAARQIYEKIAPHRAIAASKSGDWYWSRIFNSKFEAEEDALFGCDEVAGQNPFADPSRQHECALVDVDGVRLVE